MPVSTETSTHNAIAGKIDGPLHGVRILDLSRVLAGPLSGQLLADLGAEVIKVERPRVGDDSRSWGPPFMPTPEGSALKESTYFHAANRGKRSVTVDLAQAEGQALVKSLASRSDVLIENYKVGTLDRYGLGFEALSKSNPGLIYCSITGFGQTGPYRMRPGYDTIIQAMSGLMSITGEAGQEPQRVGVAVIDVMTGLYATVAILAALRHRSSTGLGQHIDLALFEVQLASLANIGMNYLATGDVPQRSGNTNPTIQPSGAFHCSDGQVMVIVGNDGQFTRLCAAMGMEWLVKDERFATNAARVTNVVELHAALNSVMSSHSIKHWLDVLGGASIPIGPINDIEQAFSDPHVQARDVVQHIRHEALGHVPFIANPIRFSRTPVSYTRPSPMLSQHTAEVLKEVLGLSKDAVCALSNKGVV